MLWVDQIMERRIGALDNEGHKLNVLHLITCSQVHPVDGRSRATVTLQLRVSSVSP